MSFHEESAAISASRRGNPQIQTTFVLRMRAAMPWPGNELSILKVMRIGIFRSLWLLVRISVNSIVDGLLAADE